ncbi:MAG: ATP-binding protein [Treponemataceae bacterium]|nr:ATP-binding protein [Treponemataceae bacterium]
MKKLRTWVLLIIVNGIVMISGFSVLIIKTVNEIKNTSIAQSFENMRIFAVSVSNILSEYVDNRVVLKKNETINWIDTVDKVLKDIAQDNKKFRITLLDSTGGVVGDSDAVNLETLENQFDKEEVIKALNGEKSTAIRKSSLEDLILLYYATPLELDGENFVLRLSIPKNSSIYFTTNIQNMLILTGFVILCFVLMFTSIICFNVIKGLKELDKASIEYSNGNFDYDPRIESTKEISDLSQSFVIMAQSLKVDREKVKRLEQIRKDFVANVSHELKTPITSIKGFAETLLDGAMEDKETAKSFISIIDKESGRLFNIIEDLLDLSRLEQENEKIASIEINLCSYLSEICKKYDIKFVSQVEECFAYINLGLFTQAINNLIENAVKYGGDKNEIECILGSENYIAIQDKGPGIPQEFRARVFERFYRIDEGRSRSTGGTGLGLSIVRHIINLHGFVIEETGRLDGESGCRFIIKMQ